MHLIFEIQKVFLIGVVMKKILIVISLLLAACFAFTGCTKKNADSKVVDVEIWHSYNGPQQDCLIRLVEKYNASQSKYNVKLVSQDNSGFANYVYNAVANGIGPSIIFNYGSTAVDYANEGLALDIGKFIEEDEKAGDKSLKTIIDSLPEAVKTEVYGFADGGIYYLPGCTTGPVFFYNKTIYDSLNLKAPTSWEELAENSRIVYEKKGMPGFFSDGLVDNLQSMIMQNNLGYIDVAAKKVLFCNDKMVEIYKWYADNCKKGYFEFNTIGKYASEDLANGDIAAFSGSCVNDQYIVMVCGDELGMAPMISSIGDTSFYTGWNRGPVMFKKNDDVDKGTYDFIKFFLQPQNNVAWAAANSALSPYGTSSETKEYKDYLANLKKGSALPSVQANMSVAGSFQNVTGSSQIRNLIVEYLNVVVDNRMTAEEAVKQLEIECNKALNQ